ncbi:hypothetical protein GGS23DRAFT_468044 [Durotheca rogersii]|uniref:uncharacterized protein n=1 Tax=Durotheca rogersii TaxID=419775 RepID=UPI00221F5801|nr:uncharacterized protein GGS23DRAFT_468044 [Durotheca rogersii]KAI5864889.1 hypothetical protein GGS23DRAFT_468044 [Durotheca rogersii]
MLAMVDLTLCLMPPCSLARLGTQGSNVAQGNAAGGEGRLRFPYRSIRSGTRQAFWGARGKGSSFWFWPGLSWPGMTGLVWAKIWHTCEASYSPWRGKIAEGFGPKPRHQTAHDLFISSRLPNPMGSRPGERTWPIECHPAAAS